MPPDVAFPECDQLKGHQKKICRCETNLPIIGPHGVNSYRRLWGIAELDPPDETVDSPQRVLNVDSLERIPSRNEGGVGTELKKLLKWFGQYENGQCNCANHAKEMDTLGIHWCEKNVDTIVGWLHEEATKRTIIGWLANLAPEFSGWTERQLVLKAIQNAKAAIPNTQIFPRGDRGDSPVTIRRRFGSAFRYHKGTIPQFVSTTQLMHDTARLASMLPADTSAIIGIARSGLSAASMVAQLMHVPLMIYRPSLRDIVDAGNGWRLSVSATEGSIVVIDDNTMTGRSLMEAMPIIKVQHPKALCAVVYRNKGTTAKPDMFARELEWPVVLEWNVFNGVYSEDIAVDFDGILCEDCGRGQDDDGPRYMEFLRTTKPKYFIRRSAIPLIITGRLEKYREETESWLSRHGMKARELIMGPWANLSERYSSPDNVAEFKAKHYAEFLKRHHRMNPPLFIESDRHQAERIAAITDGIVVCPSAGRCF